MAKKNRALSDNEKKVLDLRQKLEIAKKADETKSTDATKKAVADATAAIKPVVALVNRERFVRVGNARVKKAKQALVAVAGIAQPRSYTYTSTDVDVIEKLLTAEIASAVGKMRSALTSPGAAKTAPDETIFTA